MQVGGSVPALDLHGAQTAEFHERRDPGPGFVGPEAEVVAKIARRRDPEGAGREVEACLRRLGVVFARRAADDDAVDS